MEEERVKPLFADVFNPEIQIMKSSKLKEFADNSKLDENSGKFSKGVEDTVGKDEIGCCGQIFLFPKCFQKTVLQRCKNKGLFGKGLIPF